MDSKSNISDEISTEVIFQQDIESTEDPPMEEWSSLDLNAFDVKFNIKKMFYEKGVYAPGSGELCAKYMPQSDSDKLRHVYYSYPPVTDPGILHALVEPDSPIIYSDDGQQLYLVVCEQMNQCPVRMFYRGLLRREINLQYYGINPYGVRPMAMALSYNNFVTYFNLTDNFLNDDACYHLGDMLKQNNSILELNMSGCRIGPNGFKIFLDNMFRNKTLKKLNLSKNNLSDDGMIHLAKAVFRGLNVMEINLSGNNISGRGVESLTEAFETHNKFTFWNLSWNKLFLPGTYNFLSALSESTKNLTDIDLSWNNLFGPRVAMGIKSLFNIPTLSYLNLSNNRLEGEAIENIVTNLKKATNLVTLNLSFNPMTTQDSLLVLQKLKLRTVSVLNMYMDNVSVSLKFLQLLDQIKQIKPQLVVTYGDVIGNFKPVGPNMQELILNRVEYLCKRPKKKKKKIDFALIALQLQKENITRILTKDFIDIVQTHFKAPLDEDLIEGIVDVFPYNDPGKKSVDINLLVEYIRRKWPDRHLPPTPPQEIESESALEPEPLPPPSYKGKSKGKK